MEKFYLVFREKIFFWVLTAVVSFVLLYPKIPLFTVSETYVAVRLEDILIFLISLSWFFLHLGSFNDYLKKPIFRVFLLFWFIGLVSLISAILITYSVSPHLGVLHWLRRIEYMIFFPIAATSTYSSKQVLGLFKVLTIISLLIVGYGFGQQWLNFPVISTTNKEFSKGLILYITPGGRVNSTFAGHYDLAIYLSIILIFAVGGFFYTRKVLYKIVLSSLGVSGFILLSLTAARLAFLATFVSVASVLFFLKRKVVILLMILLALILVASNAELRHRLVATVTVSILGGGGPKYIPDSAPTDRGKRLSLEQRQKILDDATRSSNVKISTVASDLAPGEPINTTELGVFRSFRIRFDVEWPRALNAFYKNPLLGTGYSSLGIATDNDILRSLGEVGFLGTYALVLIFYIVIKKAWGEFRNKSGFKKFFSAAILSTIGALIINGLFIDVLEASKIAIPFWAILGVYWGHSRLIDEQ